MRALQNHHKVKDITKKIKNTKRKVIKNHLGSLNILNQIEKNNKNFSHATMFFSTNNLRLLVRK